MIISSWSHSAKLVVLALCIGLLTTISALAQKPEPITVRWGGDTVDRTGNAILCSKDQRVL